MGKREDAQKSESGSASKWGPPWTVLKLIEWSTEFFTEQGLDSPRFDAEVLLADVLGCDRVRLYMEFDRPLVPDELARYRAYVKRRAQREPVAYITGSRGFFTIELKTDPRALIPRPDTETLVEAALERVGNDVSGTVVDVGTGTGAIALAIATERPGLHVVATDTSSDALALAAENVAALGLEERVELVEGDLLAPVSPERLPAHMVVSNPPYIGESERAQLMQDVVGFEPSGALFAGDDGLDVIRRLVPAAFDALESGGWFLCEIGHRQGDAVRRLFESAGFEQVEVRRDYGGNDRVVSGQKP